VDVYDLHMRSLGGGGGVIQGWLVLPEGDRPLRPNLQISSVQLPIDNLLFASIPPPKDRWLRPLNLQGELVGTGEVFADHDGEVVFTVDAQLRNGSAAPNGGRYVLEDVNGSVTIERTRVQFEEFTGWHGGSSITLDGQADFGELGLGVDLTFTGDRLLIDRGLIDLLPEGNEGRPVLEDLFDTYKPDGLIDAKLVYHGQSETPEDFSLEVQPKNIGLDYRGQRIEVSDITGNIELTSSLATLHKIAGRYASGSFTIDGEARFGEDPGLALTFGVDAERIDAPARALLPEGVLMMVDRLAIQGPYVIEDARFLTWPQAKQGPTRIFEGKVKLRGTTAQIGVPVTEMDADLDMQVLTYADQPWPYTDIRVHADRLRAADRLIQRLSLHAQTGERPQLINLSDLKGSIYGGTLIGRGQLQMGEGSTLGFDLTLQEVALNPFLYPLGKESSAEVETVIDDEALPARDMSSGLLSAGLSIRVPVADPSQQQGRGIVTVRDARLYDKPLTLALLQAANLALPNESSFDRASARYLIVGQTVLFDDIRFEAPAFVISGSGSMAYPSTELNLRMVTHNPAAPDLGPVSDLVRTFKDGLLGIEVRGTLAEPLAGVVPLEGVFRSWGKVFGETRATIGQVQTQEPQAGE
jgi:AsmA-like protein